MTKPLFFTSCFILVLLSFTVADKETRPASNVMYCSTRYLASTITSEKVIPYLRHFGVNYELLDVSREDLPADPGNYALVIVAHPEIAAGGNSALRTELERYLRQCQSSETGILSFDPTLPSTLLLPGDNTDKTEPEAGAVLFSLDDHYITNYHRPGEKKELFGYMSVPRFRKKEGQVLLTVNDYPLLVADDHSKGKVAQWTSQDWMYYSILGPMGGLDDCLWKSIVWAAKKPFVLHALPPLVTMRVDDVAGCGRQQWERSPFYWIKIANKYGFKPWLGLFIYNLPPEGVQELKEIVAEGNATASPHAFGRPPRKQSQKKNIHAYYAHQLPDDYFIPDYYYPKALPFLSDYYDEFIYFDHNNQRPWADDVSKTILRAVDDWYKEIGPLPMSRYLIPHWGEMSSNMITHLHDQWNIEFTNIRELDKSWGNQTPPYHLKKGQSPVKRGPFRLFDEPVVGKEKSGAMTSRASYDADFVEMGNRTFFDFSSTINDITGYEWAPDNDVKSTVERGIEILSRGLRAKAVGVLFTHESDFIYKIKPENWDTVISRISDGISGFNPVMLTTDEALKTLRAFRNSEVQSVGYNRNKNEVTIRIKGKTDVATSVFVYTEHQGNIIEMLVEIPEFENETTRIFQLKTLDSLP